jgi:glycosyltransferase involved in cell wall biosynthesis
MRAAQPKQQTSISYLVPAFNEESNLLDTIQEINSLSSIIPNYEIIIVDDGSTDSTARIISEIAANQKNVKPLYNGVNLGFGASYRVAYQYATKNFCMLVPADNAHPAHTLEPIISKLGCADIVIPFVSNPQARTKSRQIISRLFVGILNTTMGLDIPYYNGLVAHRTELLQSLQTKTSGFAYQAEILVKLIKQGATYTLVATEISERPTGRSNAFKFKNIVQVVGTIIHLIVFAKTRKFGASGAQN